MHSRIRNSITNLILKLAESIKRFPEAIFLASLATLILITMNHMNFNNDLNDILTRIVMILCLAIPVTLCLKMFFTKPINIKKGTKLIAYLLSAVSLIIYYFYLLPKLEINTITRYIALTIALYSTFVFIPYMDKRPGFEQYVITLIRQFLITALYSFVLFIGLLATIFTIDQLLITLPTKIYLDLWLIVVGVFAPAFFLSDVPAYGEDLTGFDYSKVLKALLFFIVMPLLTVYTMILYLYFAKILITRQWPVGMVSHLVLWYSLATIFISFVIYPLRNVNRWVGNFLFFVPKLLIPLLAMMFVAMGIRVKAYGITENRYFVLVAGLWSLAVTIYLSFVKERKNVFLAISLVIITVLAVFGPWSAYSVAKHSQNLRFEGLLERNQMLKEGKILKAPQSISEEDKKQLSSIVLYFNRYHGFENLNYLPDNFKIESMKDVFGFTIDYNSGGANSFYFHVQNYASPLDVRDYEYFYTLGFNNNSNVNIDNSNGIEVDYQWENKRLIIKQHGEEIYNKDLNEVGLELYNKNIGNDYLSQKDLSFTDKNEKVQVLYAFRYLSGYEERSTGKVIVEPSEMNLFVKLK